MEHKSGATGVRRECARWPTLTNVCRVFVINCQTSFYECRKLDFRLSSLQIRRRSAPFNVYKTCVVYLSTLRFHQGSDRFPGSQRQKQKTTLSAWSVLSRPLAVPPPHVCRRLETGVSRLVRTRSRTRQFSCAFHAPPSSLQTLLEK